MSTTRLFQLALLSWLLSFGGAGCGDNVYSNPATADDDTSSAGDDDIGSADDDDQATPTERGLIALPQEGGAVFLGWRLLEEDDPGVAFLVFRREPGETYGEPLNPDAPIDDATNYVDGTAVAGHMYFYQVESSGEEGATVSEEAAVDATDHGVNYLTMDPDEGSPLDTYDPDHYAVNRAATGDLDGDGYLDYVLRVFPVDPPDPSDPDAWRSIDPTRDGYFWAYLSDGTYLWTQVLPAGTCDQWPWPCVLWDMDGDGKAEVIVTRYEEYSDSYSVVMVDGLTGDLLHENIVAPHSSLLNMLAIAYLDGISPAVLFSQGTYSQENPRITAMDHNLETLWETTHDDIVDAGGDGEGAHRLSVGDLDGDGRDEFLHGHNCLDEDGQLLWSLNEDHPDNTVIAHMDGDGELEILFTGERPLGDEHEWGGWYDDPETYSPETAVSLVLDPTPISSTMEPAEYWKRRDYCDVAKVWIADVTTEWEGAEIYVHDEEGGPSDILNIHDDLLLRYTPGNSPAFHMPLRWTGDDTWEGVAGGTVYYHGDPLTVADFDLGTLVEFDYPSYKSRFFVGDVVGDYREEIVSLAEDLHRIVIYTNTGPLQRREVTPLQDLLYRGHLAQTCVGYTWLNEHHLGGYPIPQPHGSSSIRGTITENDAGLVGISIDLEGESSDGVTISKRSVTLADGAYEFSGLPESGTFLVTPEGSGYEFDPAYRDVVLEGEDVPGQDFAAIWQLPVEPDPVIDACTDFDYEFAAVAVGDEHYVDRTYTVTSIPAALTSHWWLKTAMDDKACSNDPLVTLTAAESTELLVGYREGWSIPSWLESWTDTGQVIEADHSPYGPCTYSLYATTFPAGPIELGPCADGTDVMYIVLLGSESGRDDLDPDGSVDDDDRTRDQPAGQGRSRQTPAPRPGDYGALRVALLSLALVRWCHMAVEYEHFRPWAWLSNQHSARRTS